MKSLVKTQKVSSLSTTVFGILANKSVEISTHIITLRSKLLLITRNTGSFRKRKSVKRFFKVFLVKEKKVSLFQNFWLVR